MPERLFDYFFYVENNRSSKQINRNERETNRITIFLCDVLRGIDLPQEGGEKLVSVSLFQVAIRANVLLP